MAQEKSHYSLAEAAEIAKCKPNDLLHYAAQMKITLLVGVPDWVDVRIYDETTNSDTEAFLMSPQLLVLAQSHCLKIELNGRTEQSDFSEGYFIESSGELRKILPSYGHPEFNHRGAYWRTFRNRLVNLLELVPERLFVRHSELALLIEPGIKQAEATEKTVSTRKSNKPNFSDASVQRDSPELANQGTGRTNCAEKLVRKDTPLGDIAGAKAARDLHKESLPKSDVMLRLKQVQERTGLSRSTIYNKLSSKSPHHDPAFPKQIQVGTDSVRWLESEVQAWIDSRISASRSATAKGG